MIRASDITVSCPCLFPDEQPIWMLRESAERHGWQLRPYGLGEGPYAGWVDLKIHRLLREAQTCPTSHLLYTDARDAFFLAGPEEVAAKYNAMGTPDLLLSAQPEMFSSYTKWYEGIEWDLSKPFPYVSPPGMLCSAKALAPALQYMLDIVATGAWSHMPDDDPPWWLNYMRERPGLVTIDYDCAIFMNTGWEIKEKSLWWNVLEIVDELEDEPWYTPASARRAYNKLTQQLPCILHFNAGYSHHLMGKWDVMRPYWRALGYTSNPPWEREA